MGLFICSLLIVLIVKSQVELQVASYGSQRTVCCEQDTSSKIYEFRSIVENYLNMVNIELINTNDQVKELKVTINDTQETFSSELAGTRRKVDELQVTVSENQERVSSEVENAIHKMNELQIAVSANQETVSSELAGTRRKVEELQVTVSQNHELQVAVSENQERVSSEVENAILKMDELQVAVSGNQETVSSELENTRRKVDELQVAVSSSQEFVTSEIRNTSDQLTDTRLEMGVMGRQVGELQKSVSELIRLLNGGLLIRSQPKDCSEIHAMGVTRSGVYTIKPLDFGEPFRVYCDMETDGGGWTVFQRRQDGSVDFYLDFASYSRGFGNLEGEFWLGNDNLHRLTTQGDYELRVELSDFENESRYATYDSFSIADVSDNYRLTVGSYSGTAGDSLSYHNNCQFSTKDRNNDVDSSTNCAQIYHGAWWFRICLYSNLNGAYLRGTATKLAGGVIWYHWKGTKYSLKTTEMKIRPTPQ